MRPGAGRFRQGVFDTISDPGRENAPSSRELQLARAERKNVAMQISARPP